MPLPYGSRSSTRGLLGVNHENHRAALCFPGNPKQLSRQQVEVQMAAVGFSIVEIAKEGNQWRLIWTLPAIKDYYLNNILIHELGHVLSGSMPFFGTRRFDVHTKRTFMNQFSNMRGSNEEIIITELGQVGTQFDGFAHQTHLNSWYNCQKVDENVDRTGFKKFGIHNVGTLFTRGVLIDVAGFKGVEMLGDNYEITVEDLEGALKKQNLTLQPGDAVIIHTGWGKLYGKDNPRYVKSCPGIGVPAALWLAAKDPMLLGADKRSAAEFSFFLAIPIMFAATLYDLSKSLGALVPADAPYFAVGFVISFVSALVVVDSRPLLPPDRIDRMRARGQRPPRLHPSEEEAVRSFRLLPKETTADPALLQHLARAGLIRTDGGYRYRFDPACYANRQPVDCWPLLPRITAPMGTGGSVAVACRRMVPSPRLTA